MSSKEPEKLLFNAVAIIYECGFCKVVQKYNTIGV